MVQHRLERFAEWVGREHIDFAFLSDPKNVFYFTGFKCDPHERLLGLFIIPGKTPFLVCPNMEVTRAEEAGWTSEIIGYDDDQNPWHLIQKALAGRGISRKVTVAIETETLSFAKVEQLRALFDDVRFVSSDEAILAQRLIKGPEELEHLKKAAELADFAVNIGKNAIKKGKTELALVAEIEYEVKKAPCRTAHQMIGKFAKVTSFCSISALSSMAIVRILRGRLSINTQAKNKKQYMKPYGKQMKQLFKAQNPACALGMST